MVHTEFQVLLTDFTYCEGCLEWEGRCSVEESKRKDEGKIAKGSIFGRRM
jgi:hypothetical protein